MFVFIGLGREGYAEDFSETNPFVLNLRSLASCECVLSWVGLAVQT